MQYYYGTEELCQFHPLYTKKTRGTLLTCGPFTNSNEIKALFVDTRINPWKNELPDTDTPVGRVNLIIDFLLEKYHINQKNALVLFLYVLSDQKSENDACGKRLLEVACELENELRNIESTNEFKESITVETEPGFFDYILGGTEGFEAVAEIADRITSHWTFADIYHSK